MQKLFRKASRTAHARYLIALCVAMAVSPLAAQPSSPSGDSTLPSVKEICPVSCDATPAKRISGQIPDFPKSRSFEGFDSYEHYSEAVVELQLLIGKNGHVGSMLVRHLVGPARFLTTSEETVKTWTYTPAILNGEPVESDVLVRITFRFRPGPSGANQDVINVFNAAYKQIMAGNLDEADKQLKAKLGEAELNLYERAHLLDLRALVALQHKDYLSARHLLDMENYLSEPSDTKLKSVLLAKYVQANAGIGDVGDAISMLQTMRDEKLDVPQSLAALVEDMKAQAEKASAFRMSGAIPDAADGNIFSAALYHSDFAIQNINGSLTQLFISCKSRTVESVVTDKAEWHVPKSWGPCEITLAGSPGTTFQVVQIAQK